MLGSIERVFGLNIAERIGSFKVCLRTKNPRTFKSGSVKKYQAEVLIIKLRLNKIFAILFFKAGDAIRTRDIHLGKVTLYH